MITLVEMKKGSPTVPPTTQITGQMQKNLLDTSKTLLVEEGVNPTDAAKYSRKLMNWAFCIFGGGIPVGVLNPRYKGQSLK